MNQGNMDLSEIGRREWPYFAVLVGFWVFSAVLLSSHGYEGAFVWMNKFQSEPVNWASLHFFTHLGDGLILPAIVILLFWRRDPAFVIAFIAALFFTAFITQFGKRILFEDWMRPAKVFETMPEVTIYDPNPPKEHSFPSGHATSSTTGGVFFAWALYSYKRWLPWLVGLLTVFLCLTRVFIGAHFPGDIFVGSIIGSLGALAVLVLVYPRLHTRMQAMPALTSPTAGKVAIAFSILLIVGQFARLLLTH